MKMNGGLKYFFERKRALPALLFSAAMLGALLFLMCVETHADEGGYTTPNYQVDITVGEDNTFFVEEIIDVNFSAARHGIYRIFRCTEK